MRRQYIFEFRPNGPNLQVILKGEGLPIAGRQFDRALPVPLNQLTVDQFRSGEISPAAFGQLSSSVSEWLFANDINSLVENWLASPDKLQLVFSADEALESALNDVPMELLSPNGAGSHLVFNNKVESFVHLLSKVGSQTDYQQLLAFPLRVLIVRSNPADLGGQVPPAAQLRDQIVALGQAQFGASNVKVDLLSTEGAPDTVGPPTFSQFRRSVEDRYHVLVYLGHGDVQQVHPEAPAASLLRFESSDPAVHEPVMSKQLAGVLHHHPVPVVILAGCLTAAPPANLLANVPGWMRGNQGMAQALINSESGVSVAVGMRCKVDSSDAELFLMEFFKNLLSKSQGNVELAISRARLDLFLARPETYGWAAPVAFTSLEREPLLGYLARRGGIDVTKDREVQKDLATRKDIIWPLLAEQPRGAKSPNVTKVIDGNRASLLSGILKQGAAFFPELYLDATPGAVIKIGVTLDGAMSLSQMDFRLNLGADLTVVGLARTPALIAAGFELWNGANSRFLLRRVDGAAPLPPGTILELELAVSAMASGICPVSIDVLSTDSAQAYWAGNNAVIVPRG